MIDISGDVFVIASETETHFLHGRVATGVIPLLDGRKTVAEIVELAGPAISADEAADFLRELERAGLLTEGAGEPRDEAAFWEYAGAGPREITERRPGAEVDVVTVGAAAPDGIAEALGALGITVRRGAAFRLVVAEDYRDPALEEINRESLREGAPWMLVKPYGRMQWLGPIFVPGRTACWKCAAHTLEVNGWRARTAVANLPITAAVTRGLAAVEAAKWLMTGSNETIEGQIRVFDTVTLTFSAHHVIRRPQCAACGWKGAATPVAMDRLVSPLTGVVREITDTLVDAGLCIAEGTGSRVLWPAPSGVMFYSRPDALLGKGRTPAEAREGCLGEAIERYSCRFHGDEQRIEATLRELGDQAVDPRGLLLYSEAQYADRDNWNRGHSEFHRIGEPFDTEARIAWVPVSTWPSGAMKYVPAGYCFLGYEVPFCGADSNGCAAGATLEDAILRGLFELVERDAVALWWYNRAKRPACDPGSIRSPRTGALLERFRRAGRIPYVLDLTTDFGIPVCAAVAASQGGLRILLGSGAGCGFEEAAWRALAEAGCMALADVEPRANGPAPEDAAVLRWLEEATLENQAWLAPSGATAPQRDAEISGGLIECIRRIEERGFETLVLDTTRPEIGVPAVRVMIPGLRPWWARFAPGRLYETPVALGWQARRLSEAELNPIPFFL